MSRKNQTITVSLALTLTAIFTAWIYLSHIEQRYHDYHLIALKPLHIMRPSSIIPQYDFIENQDSDLWTVVDILKPGESLKVLDVRHSKSFQIFKVKLSDGRVGFCINSSALEKVQNKTP